MIASTGFRESSSLDGVWKFIIDPNNEGENNGWQSAGFDDSGWTEMWVPFVWEAWGYVDYDGIAWYRRKFELPSSFKDKRVLLEFGAVDYHCRVWLNDKLVGQHEGGYTPFRFDVTEMIDFAAENTLVIRVLDPDQNSQEFPPHEILDGKQGWNSFPSPPSEYLRVGGIWQSVRLLGVPAQARIESATVKRTSLPEGSLGIQVMVASEIAQLGHICLDISPWNSGRVICRKDFNIELKPRQTTEATLNLIVPGFKTWSPSTPNLYVVKVTLQINGRRIDESKVRFGFREFEISNGRFLLNGEPIFLRGALVQGFYPDTIYAVPSENYARNEIALAKAAGLNMLRLHIKIFEPQYLDLADELGMLLWAELPVIAPKKLTPRFNSRALSELQAMITRDASHPSVVIWGIFNELSAFLPPSSKEYNASISLLTDEIKRLDSSRVICQDSWVEQPKFGDFGDGHWYYDIPRQTGELLRRIEGVRKQPFVVSEFGGWGYPNFSLADLDLSRPFLNDNERIRRFLEKHKLFKDCYRSLDDFANATQRLQGQALVEQIKVFRGSRKIAGYVLTQLYDVPCEYNGILDYFRNLKKSYDYVEAANREVYFVLPQEKVLVSEDGKAQSSVTIMNQSNLTIFNARLDYSVESVNQNGIENEISRESRIIKEVPSGIGTGIAIPLTLTKSDPVARLKVRFQLFPNNKSNSLAEESVELLIISRSCLAVNDKKVCLIGKDEGLSEAFRELGIETQQLDKKPKPKPSGFDAAVVSGNVGEVVSEAVGSFILDYLNNGGKVIVNAQNRGFTLFKTKYSVAAIPEPWITPFLLISPISSITSALKTNMISYEFNCIYPKYSLVGLTEDHEIAAGIVVAAQPREFFGAILARKKVGQGNLLLCQLDLRNTGNPVVNLLLHTLLAVR